MARTTATGRTHPQQGPAQGRPPRRHRTFGDVVRALGAFVALAVLVVGVPGALLYFIGSPFPHHFDSDVLRQPITTETFVNSLAVVVWLAWAQFAACVLVEAKAAVSGVGLPQHIPASGASQLLARQLVAALLLLGVGAATITPGLGQLGVHHMAHSEARPGVAATAQQTPGVPHQAQSSAVVTPHQDGGARAGTAHGVERSQQATKFYRIQPPEGRHHDSLWDIAQRHLGDGRRYKEIYELNKDRVQPDGSRLSQASLIRPGWVMEMPGDAHGGDLVEMPVAAPHVAHDVKHYAEHGGAKDTTAEGAHADPAPAVAGHDVQAPPAETAPAPAPAHAETPEHAPATATATDQDDHGSGLSALPEALIAAPLLAAGLLAALGRRRRTALWQSVAEGVLRTPRTPAGPQADAADALRIGADPDTVAFLDRGLRALSARLDTEGRQLPTVYAAWLTADELHLQLAWPEGRPPAPWQLGQDDTFWRLARAALPEDADTAAAAPYPGLAVLGTLDGARLLLNLEAVPGIVSLSGGRADREGVLAAVAAELATNGWSDRMTVTLVGFAEDLTALAPARVRHLADVPEVIEIMAAETAQRLAALRNAGQDSVLTGRTGRAQHTQWAPHLVLVAARPTEEEAERLAELAADAGRLGIGYLVAAGTTPIPGAAWELQVSADGRLTAPLLGLDLTAQRLPAAQYAAVLRLFAEAGGGDGPEPGPDAPPFLVDLSDQGRPGIYARLLGPFELIGVEAPPAERSALLHEALALLLLHREGVHPRVLASALWPRGVTEDVRDALVERLRDWLGTDPDGTARMSFDDTGRIVLATSVVSDWDVLQTLHHEADRGGAAGDAAARRRLLTDALSLARGRLLEDRAPGRYGWLAHEIVDAQHPVLVAEIALGLSALHLDAGKPKAAVAAVETGLGVAPDDERLWLELLRAAHATGDSARVEAAAATLLARAATLNGPSRGLPPRVEALLDDLHPTWRTRLAN
ncbi:LysM peptidoglycan-binding domain-containing protein [Actinacidiphila bryophytorum]|uniref:LysM peptidoglycan-binding domain-containing protein n=1 Tax=Actinacidiphila bryophytorum TaxID=1436133 RepID=UPI002176CA44|nr:BTAD domain-containing putative transcriptional regulator [Actinacidiphila bryophytorum]UWE07971.1 LysM peptidoglycan-binding domain-containing protein [Actinacidiphila bryophytorum]